MYIGSTSETGLHHLVYEVVDNSVDEALAGYCTEVNVTIHIDDSITVVDNGRGIPVDMHEEGVSAAEVVMTKLHAGGKFDSNSYKVSGGLHGVGVSCVNALSDKLHLEIWRPSKESGTASVTWEQDYERGVPKGPLTATGKAGRKRGTKITFKPDPTIMVATKFNFDTLAQRLRELAFLNKGLKITLVDEREDPYKTAEFLYSGGIAEFIKHLNRGKSVLHENPDLHRRRAGGSQRHGRHRDCAAVQRRLRRDAVQLCEQHQHGRRRNAPERIQDGFNTNHQCLRPQRGSVQRRKRGKPVWRRCPRRANGRNQR